MAILSKNDRGGYTVPTARLYPYQWNWDSAFAALGFLTFDRDRAWRELELLLDGQWSNGMVPSIIFRSDDPDYFPGPSVWQTQTASEHPPAIPSTGISQPPVLASVMMTMVQSGDEEDLKRAAGMFKRVLKWHRWYQTERVSDASGCVVTVHPWETGRDNCPDWNIGLDAMRVDPELEPYERQDTKHANPEERPDVGQYDRYLSILQFGRNNYWDQKTLTNDGPFSMADPGIHFILLRAHRDLRELAKILGETEAVEELDAFIAAGEQASEYFWNDSVGAFTARDTASGKFSDGFSSASALCFYAGAGTHKQRERTMENIKRMAAKVSYMLPSWDPDCSTFEPQRYWCGPVWPQMNYMISKGLEECGHQGYAMRIRSDLSRLISEHGFRECFNPLEGDGCLGTDFSWTAALWLAWASPSQHKIPG